VRPSPEKGNLCVSVNCIAAEESLVVAKVISSAGR
jgi:hypothetical protein